MKNFEVSKINFYDLKKLAKNNFENENINESYKKNLWAFLNNAFVNDENKSIVYGGNIYYNEKNKCIVSISQDGKQIITFIKIIENYLANQEINDKYILEKINKKNLSDIINKLKLFKKQIIFTLYEGDDNKNLINLNNTVSQHFLTVNEIITNSLVSSLSVSEQKKILSFLEDELGENFNTRNSSIFLNTYLNIADYKHNTTASGFIKDIIRFSELYKEARYPSTRLPESIRKHLVNIYKLLRVSSSISIAISIIELYFNNNITEKEAKKALKNLEIVIFKNIIVKKIDKDIYQDFFNNIAIKIKKEKNLTPLNKLSEIDKIGSEQFYELLKTFASPHAKIHKYIHFMIIKANLKNSGEIIEYLNIEQINLEHILPQNPDKQWFEEGWSMREIFHYRFRIGNTIILKNNLNSIASNNLFSEKYVQYENSEIVKYQILKRQKKWTKQSINERQIKIVEFAKQNKIW